MRGGRAAHTQVKGLEGRILRQVACGWRHTGHVRTSGVRWTWTGCCTASAGLNTGSWGTATTSARPRLARRLQKAPRPRQAGPRRGRDTRAGSARRGGLPSRMRVLPAARRGPCPGRRARSRARDYGRRWPGEQRQRSACGAEAPAAPRAGLLLRLVKPRAVWAHARQRGYARRAGTSWRPRRWRRCAAAAWRWSRAAGGTRWPPMRPATHSPGAGTKCARLLPPRPRACQPPAPAPASRPPPRLRPPTLRACGSLPPAPARPSASRTSEPGAWPGLVGAGGCSRAAG